MLTVSIVEDDDDDRELLIRTIRATKSLRLLTAYASAEDALKLLPLEQPVVALVDIQLPGMNGIECVRGLRAVFPPLTTHLIVLSGHEAEKVIFDALHAGADGYLSKNDCSPRKLYAAIREVVNGGAPMTPVIARKVIRSFRMQPRPVTSLTDRQQEVLQHVSHGLVDKQIADELDISVHTVRKHLGLIYHKLHVNSRICAAMQYAGQPRT